MQAHKVVLLHPLTTPPALPGDDENAGAPAQVLARSVQGIDAGVASANDAEVTILHPALRPCTLKHTNETIWAGVPK